MAQHVRALSQTHTCPLCRSSLFVLNPPLACATLTAAEHRRLSRARRARSQERIMARALPRHLGYDCCLLSSPRHAQGEAACAVLAQLTTHKDIEKRGGGVESLAADPRIANVRVEELVGTGALQLPVISSPHLRLCLSVSRSVSFSVSILSYTCFLHPSLMARAHRVSSLDAVCPADVRVIHA